MATTKDVTATGTIITQAELTAIAKGVGAPRTKDLSKLQTAFNKLEEDEAIKLLQSIPSIASEYDDTTDLKTFIASLEVKEEDQHHGSEGVVGKNQYRYTFKNKEGVDVVLIKTIATEEILPKKDNLKMVITALYQQNKTVGLSGADWAAHPDNAGKEDVLKGEDNYLVKLKGIDQHRDNIEFTTNLRYMNGVKGLRLFGEFYGVNSDFQFMPKKLYSKEANGFDLNATLEIEVEGIKVSKALGHTYREFRTEAVEAAKKAIAEKKLPAGCVVKRDYKGLGLRECVITTYEGEARFRFADWGTPLTVVQSKMFKEGLEDARALNKQIEQLTTVKETVKLRNYKFNEEQGNTILQGEIRLAKQKVKMITSLMEEGISEAMAERMADKAFAAPSANA